MWRCYTLFLPNFKDINVQTGGICQLWSDLELFFNSPVVVLEIIILPSRLLTLYMCAKKCMYCGYCYRNIFTHFKTLKNFLLWKISNVHFSHFWKSLNLLYLQVCLVSIPCAWRTFLNISYSSDLWLINSVTFFGLKSVHVWEISSVA